MQSGFFHWIPTDLMFNQSILLLEKLVELVGREGYLLSTRAMLLKFTRPTFSVYVDAPHPLLPYILVKLGITRDEIILEHPSTHLQIVLISYGTILMIQSQLSVLAIPYLMSNEGFVHAKIPGDFLTADEL